MVNLVENLKRILLNANDPEPLQNGFDKITLELIERHKDLKEKEISKIVCDAMLETIPESSRQVHESLVRLSPGILRKNRKAQNKFVKRNTARWSSGFDLLETLIGVCFESGSKYHLRLGDEAVRNDNVVHDVVVRHHARACQIAYECLWLMKGGYADGAHARWRALHEIACTVMFIEKYGNDVATRFLEHKVVDSYKGMNQLNVYVDRLNVKGFSGVELGECKNQFEALLKKYGKSFKEPYGWACEALKKERPNFSQIEKDVEMDHWRPYYKWASQNVHAGSKGIDKRLGDSESHEDVMLAGASDAGMTDPADAVSLSLIIATSILLKNEPILDDIVSLNVAMLLQDKIGKAFLNADTAP